MNGYEALAEAIVLRAVDDYRQLKRRTQHYPDPELLGHILSIEQFFASPWFHMLCCLDGEELLVMLKAERG